MFRLVSEAYETLSNPDARYAYDLDLAQSSGPGDAPRFDGARSAWPPGSSSRGGLFPDTAWQHSRRGGGAHHRDPFELFRAFFGGADPFEGSFFGDDLGMSRGGGYAAASPFASVDPWAGHHAMLANAMMMTSAAHEGSLFDDLADSARRPLPPGATSVSSQTQTSIINGVRVTRTTRSVRHADGRVETVTNESTDNIGGSSGRIPVTQRSSGQQALRLADTRQQSSGGGGAVTDVVGRADAGQRAGGSFFGRSWF